MSRWDGLGTHELFSVCLLILNGSHWILGFAVTMSRKIMHTKSLLVDALLLDTELLLWHLPNFSNSAFMFCIATGVHSFA